MNEVIKIMMKKSLRQIKHMLMLMINITTCNKFNKTPFRSINVNYFTVLLVFYSVPPDYTTKAFFQLHRCLITKMSMNAFKIKTINIFKCHLNKSAIK